MSKNTDETKKTETVEENKFDLTKDDLKLFDFVKVAVVKTEKDDKGKLVKKVYNVPLTLELIFSFKELGEDIVIVTIDGKKYKAKKQVRK
ncbi:MAG: hypothetical protein AB7U85_04895 [Alphaproteobacteria bacterium]